MNEMIHKMEQHTSVRKYKQEPIPKNIVERMVQAAQYAASSHFVQAYSVMYVTDENLKVQLAELSGNRHVKDCAAFFVCCADLKRLETACEKHGTEIKHDGAEDFIVATVDASLFAQNLALAAESLGYGICYIGGIRNNPEEVSELLHLPDKVYPVFGMTVGVPDESHAVKPRLPVKAILHENVYDENKYDELLEEYDRTTNEYYKGRSTNQKDVTWTGSMSAFMSKEKRMHMKEFLSKKGFNRR
ncbi:MULTISPECIES: oxygen-insensitive NADPH nitroreductase [Bacillus]|uniref:oxygen-insensitive NADPH nitroreductase n=1 Tax=Bacillus TaxID=1386 RepID=UPI0001A14522|nr:MULTISPECIES: oxygen-insensitive NADPH nitroreductase [Bacillus]EEM17858.1 CR(VI) reductase [Bacillus pseudomycoides DSM 12442]MED1596350.1 oxygen-insensitive NADPH nitroreductase [Bacillus pseudomycoides]MED4710145.1 oxygen-insensitive NADPH nitroreductase [Bacillus pseudomycoides]OOR54314.1 NADPH-dependent oxidoreductase [Bacillus pseudomycoides]PDY10326.1 oxygen-insensitive NADPH nitroreductase [Bacillus pseudomycoides]